MIERVFQEGLDEFVFGVVGAGGGALVALGEGEVPFAVDFGDAGVELQEALIDGAEFLDIERAVIDTHALLGGRVFEERELAEYAEQCCVVEGAILQKAEGA